MVTLPVVFALVAAVACLIPAHRASTRCSR
jgi:hypothetical protein